MILLFAVTVANLGTRGLLHVLSPYTVKKQNGPTFLPPPQLTTARDDPAVGERPSSAASEAVRVPPKRAGAAPWLWIHPQGLIREGGGSL